MRQQAGQDRLRKGNMVRVYIESRRSRDGWKARDTVFRKEFGFISESGRSKSRTTCFHQRLLLFVFDLLSDSQDMKILVRRRR